MVELVRGLSRADQFEVDANRVAVECNIAAALLGTKDYGAAAEACTRALALDPHCKKALTRRVKALIGRHEYGAAQSDIDTLREEDPMGSLEIVQELETMLKRVCAADQSEERAVFGSMFDRETHPSTC